MVSRPASHARIAGPEVSCDVLILQPAIRPEQGGLTDHSLGLAAVLESSGLHVHHLDIANERQRVLVDSVRARAVLLQLSLYGYQARGVPRWLPRLIAGVRSRRPGTPWLTYFHELWAVGVRPYRTAFWLEPWQRRICAEVADASDCAMFNTAWALEFGRARIGDRALFVPTASNVGEPSTVPEFTARSRSVAVFGSAWSRARCYTDRVRLASFLERMGIERIVDIGEPIDRAPVLPGHLMFEPLGRQPAAEVSRRLLDTRYGLFPTPWGLASKSGVFAAYQAHGVVPVCAGLSADRRYRGAPGPQAGTDFITLGARAESGVLSGEALRRRYARGGMHRLAQAVLERLPA